MTVTVQNIIPARFIPASQTNEYTSSDVKTIIDKCVVTNISASTATFSINLVTSGDPAGDSNTFVKTKSLAPGETYSCPEVIGHVLESGDFISIVASAINSIVISATGRLIS